ncbi:MAG: c-type cytochrome [Bacteroidia bacterium]|jgi:cytochrome c oxidase cbb3-type subunit 3|nr:c-type cytochrome [Bacteroidia bacterium]
MSNTKWLLLMMAAPMFGWAQQNNSAGSTYFSNALFNTLLVVIIMLLILVVVLSNSIRNIIQSDYFKERFKKMKEMKSGKNLTLLFFILFASQLKAQTAAAANNTIGGIDQFTFYFLISIVLLEVIVVILLFNILRTYTINELSVVMDPEAKAAPSKPERTILDVFNASVELEKEEEIMLDHDYDGIKELDNNLPPWWKYGFYLTILVSFVYLIHYHISGTGDLQTVEYNKEIAAAKLQVEEFMRTSANNVDETTVKYLVEASDLEAGKQIFIANCVACHGKYGEGNTVGPNLTDNYWLHGGGIADIFKTVKYGWPDKGMKSWKEDFSPIQIAQVSSYIKSLVGSNPANPKAAQGDLYTEGTTPAMPADSTQISALPADSLQKQ